MTTTIATLFAAALAALTLRIRRSVARVRRRDTILRTLHLAAVRGTLAR